MCNPLKDTLHFVIPVAPVTKKNHSRIVTPKGGRNPILIPSEQYRRFERECGWHMKHKWQTIDTPINIKAHFYIDADRKSDLCNYMQALADMLVHYGVIADDNRKIVQSWDGTRVFVDRANPRIEVWLQAVEEVE